MAADKLGDVCPACGVPAKLFEPYKEKVSEKRQRILDIDIHPVIVHAPQGFAFILILFSIAAIVFSGPLQENMQSTVAVLGTVLPFVVLGAIATGLLDGKVRFKKVTTPALKKKIGLGSAFLVLSAVITVLTLAGGVETTGRLVAVLLLSAGCLVCGTFLGLIGAKLRCSKFPGN
jgi:uncharacterized membrane protein